MRGFGACHTPLSLKALLLLCVRGEVPQRDHQTKPEGLLECAKLDAAKSDTAGHKGGISPLLHYDVHSALHLRRLVSFQWRQSRLLHGDGIV